MAGRVGEGADADSTAAEATPPAAIHDDEEDKTEISIAPDVEKAKRAPPKPIGARAATLQSALVPPGMPAAPVSAVASTEPDPTPPPTLASAGEAEDEDVTATAPRVPKIPLSVPGAVQIRTLGVTNEILDETEARTVAGGLTPRGDPPKPAPAPAPVDNAATDVDETDDGPTTQAPAPRVGSRPSLDSKTSETGPPSSAAPSDLMRTRPALKSQPEPPTSPGRGDRTSVPEPPTAPGVEKKTEDEGDAYDPEESITSRALGADLPEDSVTQQAPQVPAKLAASATGGAVPARDLAPSSTDVTGGETTTKKREAPALPADGEAESITTQAPGNLTNILRVIAADAPPSPLVPEDDDDALPQNRTAVMANAPLKDAAAAGRPAKQPGTLQGFPPPPPPIGGGRLDTRSARAVAAPRLEPESDSGLRVARPGSGSGERVSTGQIAHLDGETPPPPDQSVRDTAARAPIPFQPPPQSLHDIDFAHKSGPRYGLIVGIALAVSILVPVLLYVALNKGGDEPVPEPVAVDAQRTPLADPSVRPKAPKKH